MNTLSDAELAEGWMLLFNGKNKYGWHIYNNRSDGSAWEIMDGCLHFHPKEKEGRNTVGGGDIVTDEVFENFHLKLEWKVEMGGNSGIIFYIHEAKEYEQTWHTGLEIQVLDNDAHKDALIEKHKAGDLYDLISADPQNTLPAGQWNIVELICNQGELILVMNGTKVIHTTLWNDQWKELVAGSKFKDMPAFGTFRSGKIALQDHGDKVWYRNIFLRKL